MLINHEVSMFGEVVIGVSALPCLVPRNPDTIDISEQDIHLHFETLGVEGLKGCFQFWWCFLCLSLMSTFLLWQR